MEELPARIEEVVSKTGRISKRKSSKSASELVSILVFRYSFRANPNGRSMRYRSSTDKNLLPTFGEKSQAFAHHGCKARWV